MIITKKYFILLIFIGFISFFYTYSQNTKIVPLPDLLDVSDVYPDTNQFYVIDRTTIYIYKWDGFRLIKKFGEAGQGPQQFLDTGSPSVEMTIQANKLIISSHGKISEFTKDGTFIKEQRCAPVDSLYSPLGEFFLSMDSSPGYPNGEYVSCYLYSNTFKKIKELQRALFPVDFFKHVWYVYEPFIYFRIYSGNAYLTSGYDFNITCIDANGKIFQNIKYDYKKIKVTDAHINTFHQYFKTQHYNKADYPKWKKRFVFPSYFPVIKDFQVADDRLYIQTYKLNAKKENEFLIFTLQGKFIRAIFLPVAQEDLQNDYPYMFKGNSFMQFVEDLDNESWNLHITTFLP